MDVDKPHQLEIMREDLKKRVRKSAKTTSSSPKKTAKK
jgi:sRNA-binding carbon storage regulator CsrA